MKNMFKIFGRILLSFSALIIVAGPASWGSIGIEEIPESIKSKR